MVMGAEKRTLGKMMDCQTLAKEPFPEATNRSLNLNLNSSDCDRCAERGGEDEYSTRPSIASNTSALSSARTSHHAITTSCWQICGHAFLLTAAAATQERVLLQTACLLGNTYRHRIAVQCLDIDIKRLLTAAALSHCLRPSTSPLESGSTTPQA